MEAAVEAFYEAVLHRLARCDLMPFDVSALAPFQNGHTGHLLAIVRDNRSRLPSLGDDGIELPRKPPTSEGRVGDQRQAFAPEVVDDGQDPKMTTICEGIADEVQAPALVGTRRQRQRASRT